MQDQTPPPTPAAAAPLTGPYGLPVDLFRRLWSIDDVCEFCQIERTKGRQLLAAPDAPPKMRMGSARCDRWNAAQVVAWLHGDDWRVATHRPNFAGADYGVTERADQARFPGRPWAPSATAAAP